MAYNCLMLIQGDGSGPLYQQVADAIRRQIVAGALPPGSALKSETFLAVEYQVGRDAIRDALAILRNEGLVAWDRGRPTLVQSSVDRITLTLQLDEEATSRMPTPEEKSRLGLRDGEPVLEIQYQGKSQLFAASRTTLRATSPDDWAHPDALH